MSCPHCGETSRTAGAFAATVGLLCLWNARPAAAKILQGKDSVPTAVRRFKLGYSRSVYLPPPSIDRPNDGNSP
jgi:hypothetical protein